MENRKIFSSITLLIAAFALLLLASFSSKKELATQQDNLVISQLVDNENNCCCPTGWIISPLIPEEFLGHPDGAGKWDNNGDGWICFKNHPGNGNDPEFNNSNVKDNNNPCSAGEFGPCQ